MQETVKDICDVIFSFIYYNGEFLNLKLCQAWWFLFHVRKNKTTVSQIKSVTLSTHL